MFKQYGILCLIVWWIIISSSVFAQQCGTANSWSSSYPYGLYTNQRDQLYTASWEAPLFCASGILQPGFSSLWSSVSRWCYMAASGTGSSWSSVNCDTSIRPNQPSACGVSPSTLLTAIAVGTGWNLCAAWLWHTDPSIVSNISVLSVAGWWSQPRNWTCGGTYHTTTTCAAESQWLCGPAGSGSNQSFSSLTQSSSWLCTNGAVWWFNAEPLYFSTLYTAKYTWNCMWSLSWASQSCLAYQAPSPTPWLCNAGINGQSLTYSQVQNSLLCTQWIPSVTLLPPVPNSWSQWTWQCLWLWQAANATCSVNAITNGQCVSYPSVQSTSPTNLCISGIPTAVTISSGSYIWLCNWSNGGISSNLCSASCVNGQCAAVTTTTGSTNPQTTGTTTTTTTTWSNGQTSPVSLNQICTDPDGCVCYNLTIVNGSRCLANNLTGTTDSILTPVDIGEYCLDADGCTCNRTNTIVNGSVCQTDGLTWMLPWFSDLIISQALTSGTIARRSTIEITISYHNRGPDNATWSVVEYYLSPLVSKFRTSAPYTLVQVNSSGYVQSSEYQNNVLVFPVGDLKSNEWWQITIQLTLQASLNDTEIINATSIGSRVRDPKPLDNVQKIYLSLDTQQATTLGVYMINPFLWIQSMIQQYDTMNTWLRIDPVFDDIQRWDDDFMSVMTVVRNGIFEGYRYKFSRSFGADKCATRIEAINVIAKMMYTVWSTDVYTTRQKWTAYVDTNGISSQSQNFINRAHERWLLKVLSPKSIRWSLYLEPHKDITQAQVKTIIYLIYQRYGLDPSIIESLLTDENSCTTRGELAYVMTQIMRWNPNIMMWYNDEFLKQLVSRTSKLTIAQRRIEIKKIIDKLKVTEPSVLSANGYDGESLVGILEAAMAWRVYNPIVDLTTTKNFLYEKRE